MSRPVIITCALTGDSDTPGKSPHVPVTPAAIADDAMAAAAAGAAIVHVHVRDPASGRGSREVALYAEVVRRLREAGCPAVVNLTAGMGGKLVFGPDDPLAVGPDTDVVNAATRLAHVEALRPDLCSLDCGSFNAGTGDEIYVSTWPMIRSMAARIRALGVKPELEVFDFGHLTAVLALQAEGLVAPPPLVQFALGLRWGAPADARVLLALRDMLPAGSRWVAFGAGRDQLPVAALSVLLGGHVRVGLEDNLYRSRGVLATNADLVADAVTLVRTLGQRPATPEEARAILGLAPAPAERPAHG
ncbi:MAG: 3-keto-5-aminohexanoate cleavage protein [Rhodobacteraceae bacterium]|nr:3-keto-5-aminohexanoate cleavage protein [Paracoccaceae bacterium]